MKKLVALTLIFTVVSCGGGGGSDSNGAETSRACGLIGLGEKIINGNACGDIGRSSVVRVIAQISNGAGSVNRPICTGSLVTPNVVLTAAHCVDPNFAGMGVYVGEPGAGRYVPARAISIAPGYRFEPSVSRSFNDAALLQLTENLPIPVLPILTSRSAQVGEPGFVYGYGKREEGTSPGEGDDFFTLESGAMTVANVTPDHIFVVFDGNGVNVCNGDSGGPLVIETNGQPAVTGVVSEGSVTGCEVGDITTFTNLQSTTLVNWLNTFVPNAFVRSAGN